MDTTEEAALVAARDGAYISNILPVIEKQTTQMLKALDFRMKNKILNGGLSAAEALSAWHERVAHLRLLTRLTDQANMGTKGT